MDQIRESLTNLSELDNTQLEELSSQIVTEFEAADSEEVSAEVVEKMTELANALDDIKSELANREAQTKELSDMKEAAVSRVRGEESDEDDHPKDEDDVPQDEEDEDEKKTAFSVEEPEDVVPDEVEEDEPEEVVSEETDSEDDEDSEPDVQESGELATEESPETELSTEEVEETPETVETELSATEEDAPASDESAGVEEAELSTTTRKDSEAEMSASVNDQSPEGLQAPDTHRPSTEVREDLSAFVTITAGGDIRGVTMGSELSGMNSIAEAMSKRIHDIRRTTGGDGEQFSVATLNITYPESRTLTSGDDSANSDKIEAVSSPKAVTAAGGMCAPVAVNYDVFGFGSTDRPVKDSLATFGADRGGIRYSTSPVLGDLDGAVSVWTLQDDIDAATEGGSNPTKPCIRVNCGDLIDVVTDAIPLCLTFGNLQSRAFPELVARNNDLALITHARFAEQRLLTRIGALSTTVSAAEKLGAARDFFVQVDQAAAGYRSRHRLLSTESLRVILPHWFKNMIRADLVMSMPGGDDTDRFAIADNAVDAWFRARNINVTWSLDGETGQIFGSQGNGALLDFPGTLVWYLFAEGTFLFLDGGTLDLGLVRDSSLNATNDYKMFVETFEAVAKVGVESLRIASSLDVNGAVAGTVDPASL